MIAILSPAKTLDYDSPLPKVTPTVPRFGDEAVKLAASAANLSQKKLAELMSISKPLAKLNADRFDGFVEQPERPALFAFAGDVYTGFEAKTLDEPGIEFAQDHVRMLSGLYGLLRPLDAMRSSCSRTRSASHGSGTMTIPADGASVLMRVRSAASWSTHASEVGPAHATRR